MLMLPGEFAEEAAPPPPEEHLRRRHRGREEEEGEGQVSGRRIGLQTQLQTLQRCCVLNVGGVREHVGGSDLEVGAGQAAL